MEGLVALPFHGSLANALSPKLFCGFTGLKVLIVFDITTG